MTGKEIMCGVKNTKVGAQGRLDAAVSMVSIRRGCPDGFH